MSILFLDFETYYDREYSLRKLTPPEYILDPRYETIGCAVAVDKGPSQWIDGPDFADYMKQHDPAQTVTVTFNALFDNCILAWKYGFIPRLMLCTMRMSAALRGHLLSSVSLKNVAEVLELGEKTDVISNVMGLRRTEIMNDPVLWRAFQAYANNDNDLNRAIFRNLINEFPPSERRVMDHVIRCAVEPAFQVDTDMLRQHLYDLEISKKETLIRAGAETSLEDPMCDMKLEQFASKLRSTDKFVEVLKSYGIEPDYKPSTTDPKKFIPAFAKTDAFMERLQEHEDPDVQALAVARLGLRSTIEAKRGEKIRSIASLPWPSYCAGNMPIPLRYSGAHTHRLSGEWKINMQNLPAGRGKKKSKLRHALKAPPGYKVLVADLSQIECRICAWLVGEVDLLKQFADRLDPYGILGTHIFGYPVFKNTHPLERFIGKTGVLGLGFGCGHDKFFNMVLQLARSTGMDMAPLMAIWTPELAQKTVDIYRQLNWKTRNSWGALDGILHTAWLGVLTPVKWGKGGVVEIGQGYVKLPNQMKLVYDVSHPMAAGELTYKYGRDTHRMYGPKFLENIVQALARIVIMNAALRLWDRGYKFRLQSHDELAFIVREDDAENATTIVMEELCRRPGWALDLPLDAEVGCGQSYGDAK